MKLCRKCAINTKAIRIGNTTENSFLGECECCKATTVIDTYKARINSNHEGIEAMQEAYVNDFCDYMGGVDY